MALPGVVGVTVLRLESGAGKMFLARLAILSQEIISQAIEQHSKRCLSLAALEPGRIDRMRTQLPHIGGKHRELPMLQRAVFEKTIDAVADGAEDAAQPLCRPAAHHRRGQLARSALEEASKRRRRDQPPIEQRAQSGPQPPPAQLR